MSHRVGLVNDKTERTHQKIIYTTFPSKLTFQACIHYSNWASLIGAIVKLCMITNQE